MTAAIYCRLSKEDEDKQMESESIQNQKSLLVKYAIEKSWDIYHIYCDEDYSGADRERPAFCQLLQDAEEKRFDLILVKTQSRFTRDMELVERYLHGFFPLWGIRFVAVVDNVDTDVRGNKKARQINGLINEWYLEDLSENIRTVFDYKRHAGQYIGSFPLYGYLKDPHNKNQLIVDPQAAEVVRKIFKLFLSGHGKQHIAQLLNEEGYPNPSTYKQQQGWNYVNGAQVNDLGLWNRTTVGRILRERMYCGDLVQGRRKKVSYKSKQLLNVAQEDWVIVPETHEAIIDKESFASVQRLLQERTRSMGTGEVHLLAGKVKCMDCGSSMLKVSTTYQGSSRSYLRCKLFATDKRQCSRHSLRLDALEEVVTKLIKDCIVQYYDPSHTERLLQSERTSPKQCILEKERKSLALELERRSKAIRELYLDKAQGLVRAEQFRELNDAYEAERKILEDRLAKLHAELDCWESWQPSVQQERLQACLHFDKLPRDLVAEFIDLIEIGERDLLTGLQMIHIHWRI